MKKIIIIDSSKKEIEHTHFSGKHGDVFNLVDKKANRLCALRVESPNGKQFNIFFDEDQNMYKYKNYVVFGGQMIWGNIVIGSLTPDQTEFMNVSKEDFELMKPLFEFD